MLVSRASISSVWTHHSPPCGIRKRDALAPQECKALPGSGELLNKQPTFQNYLPTPIEIGTIHQRNTLTLNTWVGGKLKLLFGGSDLLKYGLFLLFSKCLHSQGPCFEDSGLIPLPHLFLSIKKWLKFLIWAEQTEWSKSSTKITLNVRNKHSIHEKKTL